MPFDYKRQVFYAAPAILTALGARFTSYDGEQWMYAGHSDLNVAYFRRVTHVGGAHGARYACPEFDHLIERVK